MVGEPNTAKQKVRGHDGCCRRTLLVIAHRVNTIMDSDMLLVLSDGKLVEQGSPSELSRKPGGAFARLVQAAQQSHR